MEEISLRLDCEKWTKYKNLMNKTGDLVCPECKRNHTVNVEQTLKMSINQEKIKRKQIEMALEKFSKDNLHLKIDENFDNLNNNIDLHVEELIKEINDLRIDIVKKIDQKRKELIEDMIKVEFQQLNKETFTKEIENTSDLMEKIEKEDNYLRTIENMESKKNKILDRLEKNQFESKNMTNEIENKVGKENSDNCCICRQNIRFIISFCIQRIINNLKIKNDPDCNEINQCLGKKHDGFFNTIHSIEKQIHPLSKKASRLGKSGKYYCGQKLDGACRLGGLSRRCCDGICGPADGCNCSECMMLDIKYRCLTKGWLVNKEGFRARRSQTGLFYCGRKCMENDPLCDGQYVMDEVLAIKEIVTFIKPSFVFVIDVQTLSLFYGKMKIFFVQYFRK
ncbi:E3 ubiquitin- ligase SINA-like 4 [Brachionus plicatilis]|uniref:E3 ubiquitin-ligase SINA-like 4 n=1 Tax=Brachionus plicatilis TaxID=10195 RepID=A0A3M7Q2R5_BRAPC|nr:E3 ubiquitin- ligase SINA-like 4 [Brachionus plicatilis]